MELEFVGGARTVTGSSYILKDKDFQIMIDCGMFQGRSQIRERNLLHLIYAPPQINTLQLTHAHIDHKVVLDTPGKYSYRYKEAGAVMSMLIAIVTDMDEVNSHL